MGWVVGWVALLTVAMAGFAGALQASTGRGAPGKPPEPAGSPDRPVSWVVAPDDVQAAEAYLRERFADRFGGLYVEEAGNGQAAVVVVLTRPLDPAGEQALRDRLAGHQLRFEEGQYTLRELEQVQATLNQNMARLQAQGVEVVWTGVDVRTNRVTLGVSSSVAEARAAIQSLPGAGVIEVVAAEPVRLLGAEGGPAVTAVPSQAATATDAIIDREPTSEGNAPAGATGWWAALMTTLSRWWAALVAVFR
ncbi:alpha-lytic protease prodomain-containing protein [Thermaerobacter sp. PB12/4term]|uniref:alpha-lytic protease prodomain-containing protein n=1 Tax=Thermaerobacter sp. PB12/4term TaxID=2293838 RepID=UPI001FAD9535|nr:alpha-lytic protease prodomain-containing protein [Thermaerobacter sp. PB12/4term]